MAIEGFSEEMAANETLSAFEDNNALGQAHLDLVADHSRPWKDRLSDDFKKDKTNLEALDGLENFEDVVKGFVGFHKNQPVVPEGPDKYTVPDGENFKADEKLATMFRAAAHKGKLTQEQADMIANDWNGYIGEVIKEATEAEKGARETATNSLKDLWKGDDYDKNIESVNKISGLISKKAELSDDDFKSVKELLEKNPALSRMLHVVAGTVSEDAFEIGAGAGSPDKAQTPEAFIKEVFEAAKKKEK